MFLPLFSQVPIVVKHDGVLRGSGHRFGSTGGRVGRHGTPHNGTGQSRSSEILPIREEMCMGIEIGARRPIGLRVFDLLVYGVGIDHDADRASEMLVA